jgi:hypothetical protein
MAASRTTIAVFIDWQNAYRAGLRAAEPPLWGVRGGWLRFVRALGTGGARI